MSRRLLLFIIATVLAVTITATSAYVNIMFAPWRVGEPLLIVDPYDNISAYPYATISVVGNSIVMKFADIGEVYIVPFAIVFPATPGQIVTKPIPESDVPTQLAKLYVVCLNVSIVANGTVSISVINKDVNPYEDSAWRSYYFGLIGLAVGKSLFTKYGYNVTFDVNTKVRHIDRIQSTSGGAVDDYIVIKNCTFYNATHLKCGVVAEDTNGNLASSYYVWFINKTITTIGGDEYYIYLVAPSEIGKLHGNSEMYDFYAVFDVSDTQETSIDAKLTTLNFTGTSGVLRICMTYQRGSIHYQADRPPYLPIFPIIGAYLDIVVSQIGTAINMTLTSITATFVNYS